MLYIFYQTCCAKWKSSNSTDFCVSNGVKQGAVILPLPFSNYMDSLFKQLKRNVMGCQLAMLVLYMLVYLGMQMPLRDNTNTITLFIA